jgi:hypothetical protein
MYLFSSFHVLVYSGPLLMCFQDLFVSKTSFACGLSSACSRALLSMCGKPVFYILYLLKPSCTYAFQLSSVFIFKLFSCFCFLNFNIRFFISSLVGFPSSLLQMFSRCYNFPAVLFKCFQAIHCMYFFSSSIVIKLFVNFFLRQCFP